jgi:hypothetical protein
MEAAEHSGKPHPRSGFQPELTQIKRHRGRSSGRRQIGSLTHGKKTPENGCEMSMSKELKKDWLPKLQQRYGRRTREGKTRMLDELCADYQYERKYAIKLLSSSLSVVVEKVHPGPLRRYDEIEPVVKRIWLAAEQPCGKRLVPILRQWLPYYERRYEALSRGHRKLVGQISAATLDRLLAPARASQVGRGRCGTKPGSLLRSEIPIRTGTWDLSQPGYLEADSVAHCGGSLAGDFIWSLTYTDIFLESDLYGHFEWLDRRWCGVEQGRRRRAGSHSAGGRAFALRLVGLRFGQRRGVSQPSLMVLHEGEKRSCRIYSFPAIPLRRQCPCGAKELDLGAPTPGIWPAGRSGVGGADQRVIPRGVGAVAEFLFTLFETQSEVARRQSLAQAI